MAGELLPWSNPITVNYSVTALLAWWTTPPVRDATIVVENGSATETVIVNICTSCRGKPDEIYPMTIPPGEQRSLAIPSATGLMIQLDGHTQAPGTTAPVAFAILRPLL